MTSDFFLSLIIRHSYYYLWGGLLIYFIVIIVIIFAPWHGSWQFISGFLIILLVIEGLYHYKRNINLFYILTLLTHYYVLLDNNYYRIIGRPIIFHHVIYLTLLNPLTEKKKKLILFSDSVDKTKWRDLKQYLLTYSLVAS